MIFLIDVDEVLAGFSQAVLDVARAKGFKIPEFTKWDLFEAFPPKEKESLEGVVSHAGFCLNLPVLPGSQEGVAAIRSLGCEVYAVTTPWNSPTWAHERQRWLERHFGIDKAHTIFTKAKHLVRGDFFLDDRPALVSKWQESNPQGLAMLWSTPFNTGEANPEKAAYRCACWDDVIESISFYSESKYALAKHAPIPLDVVQAEQRAWAMNNFGPHPAWHPLLGIQEEVGELSHAFLKREQGIRGTKAKHDADIRDAVGDVMIYLCDFCTCEGIDLLREVSETWKKVRERDWTKNKKDWT